jgi:anti-anti-sigma factor
MTPTPIQASAWKSSPFTIERGEGKSSATVIFYFHGPFTARDMYGKLTPAALNSLLEFQSAEDHGLPSRNILDLTDVPYMDSTGLGVIVRHYVRCKARRVKIVIVGAEPRVLDLFTLCKLEGLIPAAASIEEAEAR